MTAVPTRKLNCWEDRKCGEGPRSARPCPAVTDTSSHGINGGRNGGRLCWAVAGTLAGTDKLATCAQQGPCADCDFFNLVKSEEGQSFQTVRVVTVQMGQNDVIDPLKANPNIGYLVGFMHDLWEAVGTIDQRVLSIRMNDKADIVVDLREVAAHTEDLDLKNHDLIIRRLLDLGQAYRPLTNSCKETPLGIL